MLLNDLYRVIGSYQDIIVVNDERTEILFKGFLIDITNKHKHLLDYTVTFIECEKDIMYIDLEV